MYNTTMWECLFSISCRRGFDCGSVVIPSNTKMAGVVSVTFSWFRVVFKVCSEEKRE